MRSEDFVLENLETEGTAFYNTIIGEFTLPIHKYYYSETMEYNKILSNIEQYNTISNIGQWMLYITLLHKLPKVLKSYKNSDRATMEEKICKKA